MIYRRLVLWFRFDFLPYYPLLLKLWFADEEFPTSGKLLVDAGADHYLTIGDAVTVGQVVMEKLEHRDLPTLLPVYARKRP